MNVMRYKDNVMILFQFVGLILWFGLHSGCAHNPATIMGGEQTRLGFGDYGTYNSVKGLLVTDVPRENSRLKIEIDEENGIQYDPATGKLTGILSIEREIGPQITGYLVDLAKVAPEAAIEYLRKIAREKQAAADGGADAEAIKTLSERIDAIEDVLTAPSAQEVNP